ncbi:class I SAM-dependent DNA methyltransferase [Streptomyces sp. 4N124]|uniref:class I SAM-dependent DNA methyltransferase n=1 Tax=Streptomyces sp. 4N124 TaxID=3457420 RepID=UPI003FD1F588
MGVYEEQAALWDQWAATYNEASLGSAEPVAEALVQFVGHGPALELGIGAGRIALPLARRGIRVVGLDASTEMIRRLEERRGVLPIEARIADMADFAMPEQFPLIYVVASTFYLLTTSERQMSCLRSCFRALTPDGRLVIEAAVPGTSALPFGVRDRPPVRRRQLRQVVGRRTRPARSDASLPGGAPGRGGAAHAARDPPLHPPVRAGPDGASTSGLMSCGSRTGRRGPSRCSSRTAAERSSP